MDGPAVYKSARKKAYRMVLETFKNTKFNKEDIDWLIPHQASLKAINAYSEYGNFDMNKIINIVPNWKLRSRFNAPSISYSNT